MESAVNSNVMTLGTASGMFSIRASTRSYGLFAGVIYATGDAWMQVGRSDGTPTAYNLLLQPSGGNVGIGTSSPTTTLAVAGTLSATGTVTAATYAGAGTSLTGTANSLNAGIGVNQTWTSVARAIGTTYTNSTGKPISVAITATCSSATTVQGLTINGTVVYAGSVGDAGTASGFSLIVPNGATYVTVTNGGTLTLVTWYELR